MGKNDSPDRRTVLKQFGAAATGVAVSGIATGTAAARGGDDSGVEMEPRPVAETVQAVSTGAGTVESVVEAYADDVLELMADDGLIRTADAGLLATEPVDPTTDGTVEGASAYAVGEDETRQIVTVDTQVDGGRIEMSVEAERGQVVAEFYDDDGGRVVYGDLGAGAQKDERDAVNKFCCKCCVCTSILCADGSRGEMCYGPERFGCPSAPGDCC